MILCENGSRREVFRDYHFGPEYCGRALSPEEGGEWGRWNERTGDENSSR
jgi:hypothetical protein